MKVILVKEVMTCDVLPVAMFKEILHFSTAECRANVHSEISIQSQPNPVPLRACCVYRNI